MRLAFEIRDDIPLYARYKLLARLLGISQAEIAEAIGSNRVLVNRILVDGYSAAPTLQRIVKYIDDQIASREDVSFSKAKAA